MRVVLNNGKVCEADMVLLGTGMTPNSDFVGKNLKKAKDGGIETDMYHKTS